MNNRSTSLSCFLAVISITTGLLLAPCADAQVAGQTTAQTAKAKTVHTGKSKNKAGAKKDKNDGAESGSCSYESKKWNDGAHCMKSCNEQGTLCDMSICVKGVWKPYSSCFGPSSVAKNCPASCG